MRLNVNHEIKITPTPRTRLNISLALKPKLGSAFHSRRDPNLNPLIIDRQGALPPSKRL
jgi:hypothetical protein